MKLRIISEVIVAEPEQIFNQVNRIQKAMRGEKVDPKNVLRKMKGIVRTIKRGDTVNRFDHEEMQKDFKELSRSDQKKVLDSLGRSDADLIIRLMGQESGRKSNPNSSNDGQTSGSTGTPTP